MIKTYWDDEFNDCKSKLEMFGFTLVNKKYIIDIANKKKIGELSIKKSVSIFRPFFELESRWNFEDKEYSYLGNSQTDTLIRQTEKFSNTFFESLLDYLKSEE